MKQLILDTRKKEIHINLLAVPASELHITTHWFDHYKQSDVTNLGNRSGLSDGVNYLPIVESPDPENCWKREITSISVYNPNAAPALFYISEYDDETGDNIIILEKFLNPGATWTLECICSC